MADGIPRVFIGSASESLDIVEVIKDRLTSFADVVAWNDESVFPPNQYLLDSLLGLSKSFDFAILVFGTDDKVISRGGGAMAPRDNVVFELGLFMSQLDRPRTFVLRPSGVRRYRILSDLGGLTLLTYETPPPRKSKDPYTVEEKKKTRVFLDGALKSACDAIVKDLSFRGRRNTPVAGVGLGPGNVLDAVDLVLNEIAEQQGREQTLVITNLAHDMGVTWPTIKNRLIDQTDLRNVTWRTLMVDPASPSVKSVAGAGISCQVAATRIKEIKWAREALNHAQRNRNIKFECRTHKDVPPFHGFLIDSEKLYLTMSKISPNGKYESASSPYWAFIRNAENPSISQPIDAFQSWVDRSWPASTMVR